MKSFNIARSEATQYIKASMSIRLGYACINTELRENHIFTNRTCRLDTIREKGLDFARELATKNLEDLFSILAWNEAHGIKFFRISSDMFPHITNSTLIAKSRRKNPKSLAYSLLDFEPLLSRVGNYARRHGMRLTFHPDQFVILSGSPAVVRNSIRTLWMHAAIFDIMGMGMDSVMIIHGGGTYGDKAGTMRRWVKVFDTLPIEIKRRLVIENDERSYNILDVMKISQLVKPWFGVDMTYKIPIVLDIFHYACYEQNFPGQQSPVTEIMHAIVSSWRGRRVKMHISEQKRGSPLGSHSDFVKQIPSVLLKFPKLYGNLDLMVEAKMKEQAVFLLRDKYQICK